MHGPAHLPCPAWVQSHSLPCWQPLARTLPLLTRPLPPPAGRAKKGAFKDTPADELVLAVMKDVMRRTGVQPDVGGVLRDGAQITKG